MSETKINPELDLLIIEALGPDYKSANEIAEGLQLDALFVEKTLDELIENGLDIEKNGATYRIPPEAYYS